MGFADFDYTVGVPFEVQDLDYEPGFQVSAGYQASNNWDYTLKFKHFNAKEKTTTNHPSSGLLVGTAPLIKREYKLDYNVLDFEIGKQFSLTDNVSLRLSGGLRYAALNEYKTISVLTTAIGLPAAVGPIGPIPIPTQRAIKSESNFWGVGPRFTASPTWKPFGNNFRIFGDVGTSFLMGQYELSNNGNKEGFLAMLEAGGGIGYTINSDLVEIDLKAGYQYEHWLDSDLTDNILFRGFHGSYGTIGVKF